MKHQSAACSLGSLVFPRWEVDSRANVHRRLVDLEHPAILRKEAKAHLPIEDETERGLSPEPKEGSEENEYGRTKSISKAKGGDR